MTYKPIGLELLFSSLLLLIISFTLTLMEIVTEKDNVEKKDIFTDEQITEFVDFYHLLNRIHNRLISEGYIIKEGKIYKPEINSGIQNVRNVISLQ